ncbi:tetratricopeptide repeat protein [bacterium]|nr:tetratricopeptide repeat protein [bacterium]MCI0605637.1 tetratricopeptide repeat protein [bacterium]
MKILLFAGILIALALPCFAQESTTEEKEQAVPAVPATPAAQSGDFETGMKLYRQRNYTQAISEFQNVVAADPKNAAAWYMMGYAHYVMKHKADALEAFSKAFEADPAFDPRPYFRRG